MKPPTHRPGYRTRTVITGHWICEYIDRRGGARRLSDACDTREQAEGVGKYLGLAPASRR